MWACGPQSLLAAVEDHFGAAGRGVHIERFRAAMADVPADAAGGKVSFRTNGSSVDTEADASTPLLRVAEDAGLNPAHGCRMGICNTCDVPLEAGRVRDLRTGEIVEEPGRTVQTASRRRGDCECPHSSLAKQKSSNMTYAARRLDPDVIEHFGRYLDEIYEETVAAWARRLRLIRGSSAPARSPSARMVMLPARSSAGVLGAGSLKLAAPEAALLVLGRPGWGASNRYMEIGHNGALRY